MGTLLIILSVAIVVCARDEQWRLKFVEPVNLKHAIIVKNRENKNQVRQLASNRFLNSRLKRSNKKTINKNNRQHMRILQFKSKIVIVIRKGLMKIKRAILEANLWTTTVKK